MYGVRAMKEILFRIAEYLLSEEYIPEQWNSGLISGLYKCHGIVKIGAICVESMFLAL